MKIRCTLFAALVFLAVLSAASYAVVVDKIVVVVNSEVITQGEIDRILDPVYQQYKTLLSGEQLIKKLDDARQAVMAQLIEEKLVLSEAKRQKIEIDEKDLSAKVEESRKRFPSDEMFEQALASQHLSLKELKVKFREQLMAKRLIEQKVGSKIIITPSDVVTYYNEHIQDFAQPEKLKVSNILVKPKENVKTEKTVELVGEISRRIKAGDDFAELARTYSEGPGAKEGGTMGYVKRGDLMPEIEKTIFDMKEGEVSGMIRTKVGYHFFKVDEKKEPETMNISDARRLIEETLWMARMKEKTRGWIEDLKKHAYIAFK